MPESPDSLSSPGTPAYSLDKDALFKNFSTSDKGLTSDEVKDRLLKNGLNSITSKKKISALSIYIEQFKNTLTLILIGAAFLILFIYFFGGRDQSDLIEAGLIFAIIFMITLVGFIQEYKAEKSIESLKKLLAFKAKVKRDGVEQMVDVTTLVSGDIVI